MKKAINKMVSDLFLDNKSELKQLAIKTSVELFNIRENNNFKYEEDIATIMRAEEFLVRLANIVEISDNTNDKKVAKTVQFDYWLYDKVFISTFKGVQSGIIVDINLKAYNSTDVPYGVLYKIELANHFEEESLKDIWYPADFIYKTEEEAENNKFNKEIL